MNGVGRRYYSLMQPRGSYAKGLAKREEILDAALRSFAENGYDRTSVREIARTVGLSQAGLLHHFSSKQELFLDVLRRRDHESIETSRDHGSHSVEGLIVAVERNTQQPGLVGLYVVMSAESAHASGLAREFFGARFQWVLGDIERDVARRQDRGEMTQTLPARQIASLLVAAADGLQLQWLLDPEGIDMVAELRAVVAAFST
jgi:AcrR family transcriptional regulator